MKRLIVLRPEPGATATVEAARRLGLEAIARPLFTVEPLAWEPPEAGAFDALLLTSANAVRHGGDGLQQFRGLKAYCVGRATAAEARDAGFDIAATGDAGVGRLLESIGSEERLLHLAGKDRAEAAQPRREVTAIPVYQAVPVEPGPDLREAIGAVVALHSPRAAARFAELVDRAGLDRSAITLAAISASTVDAARDGWAVAETADAPDDPSLLALAQSLCNKPPGP